MIVCDKPTLSRFNYHLLTAILISVLCDLSYV